MATPDNGPYDKREKPAYEDLLQEARRLRSMHEEDDPTPMYVVQLFLGARQQDAFAGSEGTSDD